MSDRQSYLRAVRLLPTAVRIGRGGADLPDDETTGGDRAPFEEESEEKTALIAAEAEIRKLKGELRESELQMQEAQDSARALTIAMDSLRSDIKKERSQMMSEMNRNAEAAKADAAMAGYKDGSERGYREGLAKADAEKSEEYAAKFSSTLGALDGIVRSMQDAREKLASDMAPMFIRLWGMMLERLLHASVSLDAGAVERTMRVILQRVSDRERIMIYLNPADVPLVEASRDDLTDQVRGVKVFEILSDEHVDRGSCLVETNLGIYDARWRTQLEQITGEVEALVTECIATDGSSE